MKTIDLYTWGKTKAAETLAIILNEIGDPKIAHKTGNHIYIATIGLNQICKNILPQPIGRKLLETWLYNRIDKLRNDPLLPDNCKSFAENIIKTTYKKIIKGYSR